MRNLLFLYFCGIIPMFGQSHFEVLSKCMIENFISEKDSSIMTVEEADFCKIRISIQTFSASDSLIKERIWVIPVAELDVNTLTFVNVPRYRDRFFFTISTFERKYVIHQIENDYKKDISRSGYVRMISIEDFFKMDIDSKSVISILRKELQYYISECQ